MAVTTALSNHITNIENLKKVSKLLEQKFFYNKGAYGKQQTNDKGEVIYKTIYNKIDANVIRYAIQNKHAIMAYQQNYDKLKWLCLDFDIKSSVLTKDYDFFTDNNYKEMLINDVQKALITLDHYNVNYILEFSGNRGFHIWINLDREVNKQLGSMLLNGLIKLIDFNYVDIESSPITIDHFPKNNKPKGNKIGLGVKIPLSFHMKSNAYSYIITDFVNLKKITEITDDLILQQTNLIINAKHTNVDHLIEVLDIKSIGITKEFDKVIGAFDRKVDLDKVISMLSKCKVYEYIFSKEISQLTGLDRAVLTGTLIRLQSDDNRELGRELLLEYFSRDVNVYNEKITNEKLLLMENFFPPSLTYLQEKYNIHCSFCEENSINNVLELLDEVVIKESSNTNDFLNWIIRSEKKYLTQNDEVALNFIYDNLDCLNENDLLEDIKSIESGNFPSVTFNKFERQEEDKRRILYGLSARDRVLTTYILFEINKVLYGEYSSSNSYSYRLNYDFRKNDIFVNWNSLWLNYVKDIEDKIFNEAYNDYYILKLDIKSFYDEINQVFLREILYSKPTPMIELVLKNLNVEDKKIYKNMCEYLIYVAEKFSSKGVPQGPAFARYLAEIYLSSLDELILKQIGEGFEHYFRYVDDLVIILETKEKADDLFNQIKTQLGIRDLNLNNKVKKGYISELKFDIISQDMEKYFIDGIDETTAPKRVIDKAISMLNAMFRNQDEEINIKHMPFYLTHLINEDYIISKLDDIIFEITNSNMGRGSLYKHFYKNIVFKHVDKIDFNFYMRIKGLSRSNFINELARNSDKFNQEKMLEIINFYLNEDLEEHEKKELFRLILKYGCKIERTFNSNELNILTQLLLYTKQIRWSSNLLEQVLKYLQSIEDKYKVINILDNILSNSVEVEDNKKLVETIYIIFSEHSQKIFTQDNGQTIFNLITYISLYVEELKILDVWTKFHSNYNELYEKISAKDWYKFEGSINKQQIKDSSVILILTRVFKQEGIVPTIGTNKLEEELALYLFLYLFENKGFNAREKMKQKVREITKNKNIQFIDWCLSDNTRYFPTDEIALKNIQFNNRIVMMKDNVMLVRGRPEIFADYKASFVQSETWYDENEYRFVKININERLMNLKEKIKNMPLFDALEFIIKTKNSSEFQGKFVNVFEKGTFVESSKDLNLSFSKYDDYLILDDSETIKNNNSNFIEALIRNFFNSEIPSLEYPLNYNISINNFQTEFIPRNIKNYEDIMVYMELLNKNLKENITSDGDNIYTIELSKIKSIKEYIYIKESKGKHDQVTKRTIQSNRFSNNIRILDMYNSLYNNQYEKHLLYAGSEINITTLESTINDIVKAINTNMDYDSISFIREYLINELATLKKNNTNTTNLKLVKLERHAVNNSIIKIDDSDFPIENLNVYDFGSIDQVKEMNYKDVFNLIDTTYVYFCDNLLVTLPNTIAKIIEIINNKSGIFDKHHIAKDATIRNTEFYNDVVKVIKLQSDVSEIEAERRIHSFLTHVDTKYYLPIFKVLSSYRCFTEEDINQFVSNIINKVDSSDGVECFFPLKNKNDDNGLHQILYVKNKDIFERNSIYDKRLSRDFEILNKENNLDEFIIISDLGLSGTQLTRTVSQYISLRKNHNPKVGLHKIINGENFKQNLLNSKTITILNCIYTDIFKKTVEEYFFDELGFKGILNFQGTEICYKDYLYSTKMINKRDKDLFIEFVKKYFKEDNLKVQGKSYFDYIDQIEEDKTKNMLIARYKSMPKFHNVVFTKNTSLLKYRED